jgi:fructosamine-3-kinase
VSPGVSLADRLAGLLGVPVADLASVGGGDAGAAHRARLTDGSVVFVKSHRPGHRPGPVPVFPREAEGLAWLGGAGTVRVPAVRAVDDDVLVLEWIDQAPPAPDHDERLGRSLAGLHRSGAPSFGAAGDNWVGLLPQVNTPAPTWAEFYALRRVEPLVRRAVDDRLLPTDAVAATAQLVERLGELVGPSEPPARLHGDLWAGNAITDGSGGPVLVDPAAYGGHREIDLAMMRLFGGFPPAVFAAYDEVYPCLPGHEDRVPLYQLYPLLVHTVLFAGGYAASALAALRRYTR